MKKIFISFLMAAAMLTPVVLTSCGDDNGGETPIPAEDKNLSGSITQGQTRTLDASVEYNLVGPLLVEDGGTLNIPAGTVIKAKKGFSNYILVLQGGKINATGTAEKPVVFTADINDAGQGYWGGLIINGRAPLSGGTTGSTEINSAYSYGGTNAADNSGVLRYVKIEYTGARSSANVEHNGLTLNGVGSGTKIENIFIPNSADDGIEFFGGSVNVKNLLVVNSDDDMFDMTQGYNGTLENAYGIWEAGYSSGESDPRGVEADGNLDGNFPEHTGQSDFTIKDMTIELKLAPVAKDHADFAKKSMQDVLKIRRGAKATITNALVKGTGTVQGIADVDGANAATSISLTNFLTNPITGLNVNFKSGSYPNVKVDATGNTGCPTNIFARTGYKF